MSLVRISIKRNRHEKYELGATIETPEYRSAWLNDIAGRKVTEEQRKLNFESK